VPNEPLTFWLNRQFTTPKLSTLAEDLISMPASQASVEKLFSGYGMLTTGCRNRMEKSLQMCVFRQLNKNIIAN
jgi:hypothetical protein